MLIRRMKPATPYLRAARRTGDASRMLMRLTMICSRGIDVSARSRD